jgi:hypothetical protein
MRFTQAGMVQEYERRGTTMPAERHIIEIIRYKTPEGEPTCAFDWPTGEVCVFLQTYKFGLAKTCFFIPGERRKTTLTRGISDAGKVGEGYLIPFDGCPVWKDVEE